MKRLITISTAALLLAGASSGAQAATFAWAPQTSDSGFTSDFDTATQTFAGVFADTLTFGGDGLYHNHGNPYSMVIRATINGLNQQIFSFNPGGNDFMLSALAPITFSGGTVTSLTLTTSTSVGYAYHQMDGASFTLAAVGNVPEPATWAMMIGGFGAVGGTMRYRRRKTSVSFA